MIQRFLMHAVPVAALLLAPALSGASGSDAGGGIDTDDAQAYNIGKGVYAQKLACKGCPMAGKSLDAAMARELMSSTDMPALSAQEKQALAVYLARRFRM